MLFETVQRIIERIFNFTEKTQKAFQFTYVTVVLIHTTIDSVARC